ncbi:MAG: hypothetical protein RR642_17495, partial [Solibacillus sp.]
ERTGEKRDSKSRGASKERPAKAKRSSGSDERDPRGRRKDGKSNDKPKFYEGIAKGKKKKNKKKK